MLRVLVSNVTNNATKSNESVEASSGMTWFKILALIFIILLSAYCNGTNIGVMGLDVQQLEVMSKGPF